MDEWVLAFPFSAEQREKEEKVQRSYLCTLFLCPSPHHQSTFGEMLPSYPCKSSFFAFQQLYFTLMVYPTCHQHCDFLQHPECLLTPKWKAFQRERLLMGCYNLQGKCHRWKQPNQSVCWFWVAARLKNWTLQQWKNMEKFLINLPRFFILLLLFSFDKAVPFINLCMYSIANFYSVKAIIL